MLKLMPMCTHAHVHLRATVVSGSTKNIEKNTLVKRVSAGPARTSNSLGNTYMAS